MTLIANQVREWHDVDIKTFREQIAPAYQPAVLRGVADQWPAVAEGKASPQAIADYIKGLDRGSLVDIFYAEPQNQGRFFYRPDLKGVNFARRKAPLSGLIDRLLSYLEAQDSPAIYAGAVPVAASVPEFETHNKLELLPPGAVPRVWVGNAVTVWTHYDLSSNVACVVAGRRRFTLFPPQQVANMYVGPLDFTLAGQPVSMVDLDAPDYERYPRFREALEHAQVAELGPGDAVFIPALWWHHVKSLEPFNVLVNYWWDEAKPWTGSPFETLVHALLSLRDLPPSHRQAWRAIFDHYIFEAGEDPAAHLPADARGVLGPLTPELAYRMKVFLMRGLSGKD